MLRYDDAINPREIALPCSHHDPTSWLDRRRSRRASSSPAPRSRSAAALAAPDVAHFTLANGLEVVVIPDRRTPVVTHMVWYKVGAADEPPGKSGIAHFLEHLMFKGTEKNPAGKLLARRSRRSAARRTPSPRSDYTGYFQRIAREHLKTLMEFEADRMTGLVLTDDVVLPERDVVLEEHNQRVANNPGARLGEQIEAALYLNHPYGRPVIGWRHEIEKLNREDALAFYRASTRRTTPSWWSPATSPPTRCKTLAEETYGKVAARRRDRPAHAAAGAAADRARARSRSPIRASPSRACSAPISCRPTATAKPGEAEALDVLAHILGHGSTSRLYRTLVVEHEHRGQRRRLVPGHGARRDALRRLRRRRSRASRCRSSKTAIDARDRRPRRRTASPPRRLERAKTRLIADAVYAQDNQATLARWYGAALTTGSTVEQRARLARPHPRGDAPRRCATPRATWLDKRRSVTGYLVKDEPRREEKRS